MKKIILIGYKGKMGKCVMQQSNSQYNIKGIDIGDNINDIKDKNDIIIDFSTAESRQEIIEYALKNKIPLAVFGTNITETDLKNLKKVSKRIPVLVCSNASIGVNIMQKVLENINKHIQFADIAITEYHNAKKIDKPSGTAKSLIDIFKGKNIQVASFRVGDEVGKHTIDIYLNNEKLTLSHHAFSRNVFAVGALKMCEILATKTKGFYKTLF